MIYVIDILMYINIAICAMPDLPKDWVAVLLLAHVALLLIANLLYDNKVKEVEKLKNTMDEHIRWHYEEEKKKDENN